MSDESSPEEIRETAEDPVTPLEVTIKEKKVETVEEDLDYINQDITDKEIEEFEKDGK